MRALRQGREHHCLSKTKKTAAQKYIRATV